MNTSQILVEIDKEIARLQQVRSLLGGGSTAAPAVAVRRGRPRKDAGSSTSSTARKRASGMSAEGRKRIAEAQRKRWAAIKAAKKG